MLGLAPTTANTQSPNNGSGRTFSRPIPGPPQPSGTTCCARLHPSGIESTSLPGNASSHGGQGMTPTWGEAGYVLNRGRGHWAVTCVGQAKRRESRQWQEKATSPHREGEGQGQVRRLVIRKTESRPATRKMRVPPPHTRGWSRDAWDSGQPPPPSESPTT